MTPLDNSSPGEDYSEVVRIYSEHSWETFAVLIEERWALFINERFAANTEPEYPAAAKTPLRCAISTT